MPQEYQWTPQEQKSIDDAIEEAVNYHIQIASMKDQIKEIAETMKEKVGMKSAMFNALVNERFESKSTKNIEKHEDIVALNETLENNAKLQEVENEGN